MIVLGIETSCDETAVGIVRGTNELLAHVVLSQIELHSPYGGIILEIAARSHLEAIIGVIDQAFKESGLGWPDIDAIAVTYGAGLAGSLLVGVVSAQTLALSQNKPLYVCNHVEGHVYANFIKTTTLQLKTINQTPQWPLLALVVSGKHSQLVLFKGHSQYRLLGQATDDAIGEAFDKIGRLLGLGYPGGPAIAKVAPNGNDQAFKFPIAKLKNDYDFSFSGLKTAVLRQSQKLAGGDHRLPSTEVAQHLSEATIADLAASFERVAVATVVEKTLAAFEQFQPQTVVIAGGVAANRRLRDELSRQLPIAIDYADPSLCTDNGSMIACLAAHQIDQGYKPIDPLQATIDPSLMMRSSF